MDVKGWVISIVLVLVVGFIVRVLSFDLHS